MLNNVWVRRGFLLIGVGLCAYMVSRFPISQIGDADVTFGGFAGADAIKFVQQYDKFGVKKRIPLIGHGPLLTELVLKQIGDAAVDVGAAFYYSSSLDNAANKEFLAAMKATGAPIIPSHQRRSTWPLRLRNGPPRERPSAPSRLPRP